MPFPELTSFIFSPREYGLTLRAIRDSRPAHLFVDSNIHSQGDAWGILYAGDRGYVLERGSRLSRYELLRNLFEEVAADYEKVAEGRLISVYRRIPGR
jgi:hypothetical protein